MSAAIDEFKESFRQLAIARVKRDEDKRAAEKSEADYRTKEAELYGQLEESGIKGRHTFDFGGDLGTIAFQRRYTVYGRILDQATAVSSLRKMGEDEVVHTSAVRKGRLNAKVRGWLETGAEFPDGIDYREDKGITISRK